jgi:hypothetical protein
MAVGAEGTNLADGKPALRDEGGKKVNHRAEKELERATNHR